MRQTITALTLILIATAGFADVPPRVTLTLLPATTLPGLPVGFLLNFSSPSDQVQTVSNAIELNVSGPAGTFKAVGLGRQSVIGLPSSQLDDCPLTMRCLKIPAKGERQIYVRFGSMLVENAFFADRRLSAPGRYDLRATLTLAASPTGPFTTFDSDTQTLTIQQPVGIDLSVWNYLQQTSKGQGWSEEDWINFGGSVAPEIRAKYPTSRYAAWVAGIGTLPDTPPAVKLANLDTALAMEIPAALRDELLLEKGGILEGLSHSALFAERDADKAVALADQARSVFIELRKNALSNYARTQADDALAKLTTRAKANDAVRELAEGDPPALGAIIPRVECVQRGIGQTFSARFGYVNPNKMLKVLQIGADNQVTPAPREAGQPRVFTPGEHSNVFTATSPGGNLIWHLDGNKATATADFAKLCSP